LTEMASERLEEQHAEPGDKRYDPAHCVMANAIRKAHPWAKNPTVGRETIRVYDYRCEHNPKGIRGKCGECPGRCLVWATPLRVRQAIQEFDRTGAATFPAFVLREDEAQITARQDRGRKQRVQTAYNRAVAAGDRTPRKRTARDKERAKKARRRK
jgi:hypothetical protein